MLKGEGITIVHLRRLGLVLAIIMFTFILCSPTFPIIRVPYVFAQPSWPSAWIEVDWDKNEDGAGDDWRDVEYAYYQYDSTYLYFKLQCYDLPGKEWIAKKEGRYKWFIDLDGNIYFSGGNVFDAEYLLFVEDTDYDGAGDMFLVRDTDDDGNFGEYEPWPPADYADSEITELSMGGWRIVAPNQIEMYINWILIGSPESYWLFWATDQQNPNLDQAPTTDRIDEERPLAVHNVVAKSQDATPTTVNQGELVTVQVVCENEGTQAETFNVTCYFNGSIIGTELVVDLAAGHQTILSFDWDTTGLPTGNYTITSWADSSAAITETNEEDNWCTSLTMVTIQPAPIHDVAAISQVPDKTSVVNGTIVYINVTVSNLGGFTETFNVACFYDNNPIGYHVVTGLAAGASTSMIFAWDTSVVEPNTYYIQTMADSSKAIIEVDEINNNCTSLQTVTVYSSGDMGKLFVDKIKTDVVSGEDPPVVGLSTVYELTIFVSNVGGSDVSDIQVDETISSDVTFLNVGTPSQGSIDAVPPPKIIWCIGTLSPGDNATLTFRIEVTPTSLGLMYLNHKEDISATGTDTLSGDPVSDIGDTDITADPIVRDVAAISQIPSSTIVCQGETIAIEVTVKNFGNLSESFDVTCYYDGNIIGTTRVFNLVAGGQTIVLFALDTTDVMPGTYSIMAEADSSEEIHETDEANNLCTSPSTVKIVIHDISAVSQVPFPQIVVQGDIVTIEVTVKNEGTESETFDIKCYCNETLVGTNTVTDLDPNTAITLDFFWNTSGVQAGTYFINAVVSPVPGEKDTEDNACQSTASVTVTSPTYILTIIYSTGGITDPSSGEYTYLSETNAIVEAAPDVCYEFDRWLLDGLDVGSNNPITILMDSNHTLQPIFTQTWYELTIATTSGGTTDPVPGTYSHDCGSSVLVMAIPDSCCVFDHWELDSVNVGSTSSYSVLMDDNHTLYAVFEYSPPPPPSVSITPLSASIVVGEAVTFTSTVDGGATPYAYQWYLDDTPVSGATSSSWTFTPTSKGVYYVYLKVTDACSSTAQSGTARVTAIEIVGPVGGYSVTFTKTTSKTPFICYITLVAFFAVAVSLIQRKRK
ncbi:PKD domain-containing protein [Candidatus Bathyarchaeota archaeon]|nr:PKD domain-containing protein [Candidatus Bathyarchaeota archaeon]